MSIVGAPVVVGGLDTAIGAVVTSALRTQTRPVHVMGVDAAPSSTGGVLLHGGVAVAEDVETALAAARACQRSLVVFDPTPEIAPALLGGDVAGMVFGSGASAGRMGPFLGALPWLRLPLPIDERRIEAAAHGRAQHRAGLVSHLRLPPAEPWLLGPGPGTTETTWVLLARCLSRVLDLPWCLVATPASGAGSERAAAALRSLPPARVRLWPAPADTDLLALLVGCDLCVWPGADGADADMLLAAHAAGMPVVACRGAASDECVRDGITGRAVATGNAESLANVLRFLLVHDDFRAGMAAQARSIVIADHGLAAVGRVLMQFLDRHSSPPG